jgi:hypothetical protein
MPSNKIFIFVEKVWHEPNSYDMVLPHEKEKFVDRIHNENIQINSSKYLFKVQYILQLTSLCVMYHRHFCRIWKVYVTSRFSAYILQYNSYAVQIFTVTR